MALGDQKFDSPHPKGDPDNLSVAKPKIMRRGDEIADQIAALQMNQVRSSSNETTLNVQPCLLYTSPSPRDATLSRMPSSA